VEARPDELAGLAFILSDECDALRCSWSGDACTPGAWADGLRLSMFFGLPKLDALVAALWSGDTGSKPSVFQVELMLSALESKMPPACHADFAMTVWDAWVAHQDVDRIEIDVDIFLAVRVHLLPQENSHAHHAHHGA